ncbi:CDP-alcohol phosphatidyltransferase family protein [Cellulomonas sp. P5_C6]
MVGITHPRPADFLTLANALCGAAVILLVTTLESDPAELLQLVAVLLLCGTILDTVDGPVARRWGGTPLGAPLDNLADGVAFGVAPAAALAVLAASGASPLDRGLLVAGGLVYVGGALLRLADFSAVRHDQPGFTGLPSPLAATCAIVFGFLAPQPWAAALALTVLGLLMVSRVRYPAQRGAALALSSAGWAVWLGGALGLYPMRAPAIVGIVVVLVAVPVAHAVLPRVRRPVAVPVQVDP